MVEPSTGLESEGLVLYKSHGMKGGSATPNELVSSVAMSQKDEIRQQLHDGFEDADYPVNSPMDLVPALPNGPATTFESGDVSFTAMELNAQAGGKQEFPYDTVDTLVDDIMDGLEDEGYFEEN